MKNMISVIVTTYNRAYYLKECISSIQAQTYDNLEIIVIDDCSKDNTEDIINNIKLNDNRIRYIRHNINKGAGAAKNTGIEVATGEYITFVDSDDKLANIYAYETAIKTFKNNNIDIYTYSETNEENTLISKKYKKYIINTDNIYIPTTMLPLKIFKSKQIKKIRNNEKLKYDDIPFWVDFCLVNRPIIYHTDNKFYMRIKDKSNMGGGNSITMNEKNYIELFDAYDELNSIINKKGNNIKNKIHILYKILDGNILFWYNRIEDKKIKENYRKRAKEYIKKLDNSLNIIGKELNLKNMALFIDDETARTKYLQDIEIFKDNNYKYIKPNTIIFKIKREIYRIVHQIKNLFIKQ